MAACAVEHRLHAGRVERQDRERDAVRVHLAQPLVVQVQQPPLEHVQLPGHGVLGRLAQRLLDAEVLFDRDLPVMQCAVRPIAHDLRRAARCTVPA